MRMSYEPSATMVDRVQQTLKRLGFDDCVLKNLSDGQITLFCPDTDRNDESMIQVAVRLLPGINSVVFANQSNFEDKS